jgi:hypothetical protein
VFRDLGLLFLAPAGFLRCHNRFIRTHGRLHVGCQLLRWVAPRRHLEVLHRFDLSQILLDSESQSREVNIGGLPELARSVENCQDIFEQKQRQQELGVFELTHEAYGLGLAGRR